MAALKLVDLDFESLARLGVTRHHDHGHHDHDRCSLPLDWPELAKVLPDGGLPRGVIELASRHPITRMGDKKYAALRGGATSIALAAIRGVHLADANAWCAWITEDTAPALYAPAVAKSGVDLDRLLVVRIPLRAPLGVPLRTPQNALARTAVKVATSGAFDLVIVDAPTGLVGKRGDETVVVRKLAIAASDRGTSTILITSAFTDRSQPLPVALRLEVERRPEAIAVRVTKDRRGSPSFQSGQHVVRLAS
jgi:hypothetical protein